MLYVVDRSCRDDIARAVLRSSVGVYDDDAFPGEILQKSSANRLDGLSDSLGIVVCRQTDEQVYFANADEFAKKIIRKNTCLVQTKPLSHLAQIFTSSLLHIRRKRNQKNWYGPMVSR
jgi:hypothetical protein